MRQPKRVETVQAVTFSPLDARRAGAREIFGYLIRETLNALPPGSPLRSNPSSLGYAPRLDRNETTERHRAGMEFLRHNSEVTLAFGRLEHNATDVKGQNRAIANATPWHSEVEPVLRRGCDNFQRDRFVGLMTMVDDVYGFIETRYGSIPFPVAMGLTRASIRAYGYGFFVRYNAQHPGTQPI